MLNKIASFCYAFIAGIAAASLLPGFASHLQIWCIAICVFAGCEILFEILRRRFSGLLPLTFVSVLLAGFTGGVLRQALHDSRPDSEAAVITVSGGALTVDGNCDWGEASRIVFRKNSGKGMAVVCNGIIARRIPVADEDGNPMMNGEGLWRFSITNEPATAVVNLPDELPEGSEVEACVPFSSITNMALAADAAPADGASATVIRKSAHIETFAGTADAASFSTVLGRIADDPAVYSSRAVLTVEPYFIQTVTNGPFYRVSGGNIRVNVSGSVEDYERISVTNAYGNDVIVRGALQLPQSAANRGGFDNRAFLNRSGIYAQMSVWPPRENKNPKYARPDTSFTIVSPGGPGNEPRHGNMLVMFSLALREKMLGVIKETVPYPVSAFIGGVTLGLRYGLQGTECVLSPESPQEGGKTALSCCGECTDFISEEFRRSGVNHVLAVSGLHVTIISVMFIGIFSLAKVSKKIYAPLIILALVVFAIITGARPSTLRAVIMNSLFLLSWSYLDQSLKASVLIGVPVAGFIILLQSPALLADPSFTLSFGAILSLALLTGPCMDVLSLFRGNDFITLIIAVIGFHLIAAYDWMLMTSPVFLGFAAAVLAVMFLAGHFLSSRKISLLKNYGFGDLPQSFGGFLAAQMAIQLGMMIPLSSYYFARWSVAGAAANLLAIPLIGVVLQLAMMACVIGLIPVAGIWIALLLNAGNWLVSMAFLLVAHFTATAFPYPFVRKQSGTALCVYYAALALFVWREQIFSWIELRLRIPSRFAIAAAVVIFAAALWFVMPGEPRGDGKTHIDFLSVNYGSSVLIRTPGGKKILVDAGYTSPENTRFSQAERNVIPYLSSIGIRRLDAVAVLSGRAERISGVPTVIYHCGVGSLMLPPSMAPAFTADGTVDPGALDRLYKVSSSSTNAVFTEARDAVLRREPALYPVMSLSDALSGRGTNGINVLTGRAVEVKFGKEGTVLCREETPDGEFGIETIPGSGDSPIGNGSMMLRVYHGDATVLLTGDGGYSQLDGLESKVPNADVLVMPNHGQNRPEWLKTGWKSFNEKYNQIMDEDFAPYVKAAGVKTVVFEYGNPKTVLKDSRSAWKLNNAARAYCRGLGLEVLGTDTDGLISFTLDGKTVKSDRTTDSIVRR